MHFGYVQCYISVLLSEFDEDCGEESLTATYLNSCHLDKMAIDPTPVYLSSELV